jgi:hypothetical protein
VSYFSAPQTRSFLSTFTTRPTTFSPQKHHVLHTHIRKNPCKTRTHHNQKKARKHGLSLPLKISASNPSHHHFTKLWWYFMLEAWNT